MKRRMFQKTMLGAMAGLCLSAGAALADYPDETIRLIVPYQPGGGTDTIARAFAEALSKIAGQAVVVENIPGSAGINGMLALAKAGPDGYTIAINGSYDVSGAVAFRENSPIQFDDFACAGGVFNTPAWVLSHADNGYSDLGDFIEAARANPGKLNFGITGAMSATDFVAATIRGANGIDFNIINFVGGGPLKKALLANQVHAGSIIAPVLMSDVEAGTLNALAAAGDLSGIALESARDTKHIGDWNEDARIDVSIVRGIWMSSEVSEEVRAKMESMVAEAVTGDEFKAFADTFGYAPYTQNGTDFCARLPQEVIDLNNVLDKYMKK